MRMEWTILVFMLIVRISRFNIFATYYQYTYMIKLDEVNKNPSSYANCGSKEECTFDRVMDVVRLVFIGLILLKERENP